MTTASPIPFIDLKAQYRRIEKSINQRIQRVLESAEFIMGPEIKELEDRLANFVGTKHAITCSSGTDALLIPLMAYGIGPGDEVIVPDFSFYATAEVVSLLGATPIFVDVREDTCNLDSTLLEQAITPKTKMIIPVSLYGQCADFDEINAIAKKHKIKVMEDGAQSFGARYKGRRSCSLTDVAATSFFPSKPLGCYGDGGAIFTNDDLLAEKMKSIRLHGQMGRYNHPNQGINGRLDTIQAAILLAKLEIFETELEERQIVAKYYSDALRDHNKITTILSHNFSAWAQYTILVDKRDAFCQKLNAANIPTAIHYPRPISKQPYYAGKYENSCPVANTLSEKVVSLPMYPTMTKKEVEKIVSAIIQITNQA